MRKFIATSAVMLACGAAALFALGSAVSPTEATPGGTDDFGLAVSLDENFDEHADLDQNPYGTDGWFPLFTKNELMVTTTSDKLASASAKKFETRDDGACSSGEVLSEYDISQEIYKRDLLVSSAGLDLDNTGRDEYVAYLTYSTRTKHLQLSLGSGESSIGSSVEVDVSDDGSIDNSAFLTEVKPYFSKSHIAIAAGDFDADGTDSVIIYSPALLTVSEYAWDSTSQKFVKARDITHIGDAMGKHGRERLEAVIAKDKGNKRDHLSAVPSVQMTAADTDKDGREELVFTANWNVLDSGSYKVNGSKKSANWLSSWLNVYDFNDDSWNNSYSKLLADGKDEAKAETESGRMRYAGVAVGSISASQKSEADFPEIVVAGYIDKDSGTSTKVDIGHFGVYVFDCITTSDGRGSYAPETDMMKKVKSNKRTSSGCYTGDRVQDPVAVVTFAGKGIGKQGMLFIEGDTYTYAGATAETSFVPTGDKWHALNVNGYWDVTNEGVVQAVAGNFDGNSEGREQVMFSFVSKTRAMERCRWTVICYSYGPESSDSKFTYHETRFTKDIPQDYLREYSVALSPIDVGEKDGIYAQVESRAQDVTKPTVLAVLEAPPYFSELVDGEDAGQTIYGKSKSSGSSKSQSITVSKGVLFGGEWTTEALGAGGGFEIDFTHGITNETVKSLEQSYECNYWSDRGQNTVIVSRAPVTLYNYKVRNFAGETPVEDTLSVGVPGRDSMTAITVDEYNDAMEENPELNLEKIDTNTLGDAGDPESYSQRFPKSSDVWISGEMVRYSANAGIEQVVSDSTSTEHTRSTSFDTELTAYGAFFGFRLGGSVGGSWENGKTVVDSSAVTKSGYVEGLPRDALNASNYDFNWRFATWTQKINGNDTPVLGYAVTNVEAPASPGQNLLTSKWTSSSMVLSWDAGERGEADSYNIYRYNKNETASKRYTKVGSVTGDMADDNGRYSYKITGLKAKKTYEYVVCGVTAQGKESTASDSARGTTNAKGKNAPTFNGPASVSAAEGERVSFSVNVSDAAGLKRFEYQWQEKLAGGIWRDIDGATTSTLELVMTGDRNGAKYRCIIDGITSDASHVAYCSSVANLALGEATAAMSIALDGAAAGSGTESDPYIGVADHAVVKTEERDSSTMEPVIVSDDQREYEVNWVSDGQGGGTYIALETDADDVDYKIRAASKESVDGKDAYTLGQEVDFRYSGVYSEGSSALWNDSSSSFMEINGGYYWKCVFAKAEFQEPADETSPCDGRLISIEEVDDTVYVTKDGETFYRYTDGMKELPEGTGTPEGFVAFDCYGIDSSDDGKVTYLLGHNDELQEAPDAEGKANTVNEYRMCEATKTDAGSAYSLLPVTYDLTADLVTVGDDPQVIVSGFEYYEPVSQKVSSTWNDGHVEARVGARVLGRCCRG